MHRFVLVAGLGSAVLCPCNAWAQTDADQQEEKRLTPTEEVEKLVDGELSYEQVSSEVQDAIRAVADIRSADRAGKLAGVMALLAALFKLLLSSVKAMGLLTFWRRRQAAVIRITTLVLGIAVFLMSNLLAGMPWWEALMLSLSGPGSMVVHEYSRLFKKEA